MTPAERGVLLHRIMQYIDYNMCSSDAVIAGELQRLAAQGIIEVSEIVEVEIAKIKSFANSDIGTRLINAKDVKREFKFSLLSPAHRFFPGGGDDEILLQGVIDCFFEDVGEFVVVDFKTDQVTKETIEEKAKQYIPQLDTYAEALERITGKRVKERIIYFFAVNTSYNV
jgi:ATP-dependent helicase/nuclease subunit A